MEYVKFDTMQEAEEYRAKLQAHHDATINQDKTKPRIIDCPIVTLDGKIALTIQDKDLAAKDIGAVTVTSLADLPVKSALAKVFAGAKTAKLVKSIEPDEVKEPKEPEVKPLEEVTPVKERPA